MHPHLGIEVSSAHRQIIRAHAPAVARHGAQFEALRIGGDMFGREGDPWLNLDHFRMTGPTFPPHPHAGFSAVTYILPESPGAMANRDSRGDRSLIGPGGLHWTAAGRGIVHEEIPAVHGTTVEGFQIFIRQPVAQENEPPVIRHADAGGIPAIALPGGGQARLLAGSHDGRTAPFDPPSALTMLDLTLREGEAWDWNAPSGQDSLSLYLFSGRIVLGGKEAAAPTILIFAPGEAPLHLDAVADSRILLMAGEPLAAPSVSNGPFVLSSVAALEDAVGRYRSGAMGSLPPDWD